jgi:hypothetical protein
LSVPWVVLKMLTVPSLLLLLLPDICPGVAGASAPAESEVPWSEPSAEVRACAIIPGRRPPNETCRCRQGGAQQHAWVHDWNNSRSFQHECGSLNLNLKLGMSFSIWPLRQQA